MTKEFHKFWLLITAIVVVSFGPIFFLGTIETLSEPARLTLDILSWPLDGQQTYKDTTLRFLSALTGGFLFGWGVMIICLRQWVYDLAPDPTRRTVVTGIFAWFVPDSAGSIFAGASSNVVFNIFVLIIAIGPLWKSAK